jgi:CRP-like cAMP-binding protein
MVESSLGKDLNEQDCEMLTQVMEVKTYKDGETLVKEGDKDNTLFILIDGKIGVNSNIDGRETTVYTMKRGECAGTRAFVDLAPRQATLKAVGDTTVYTLTPEKFETLLDSAPKTVYKFMRGLFRLTHMHLMRMNAETQQLANYIHKSGGRY